MASDQRPSLMRGNDYVYGDRGNDRIDGGVGFDAGQGGYHDGRLDWIESVVHPAVLQGWAPTGVLAHGDEPTERPERRECPDLVAKPASVEQGHEDPLAVR